MAKIGTVTFTGKSGTKYIFNFYPISEECPSESGIYIFGLHNTVQNNITPLYIGKASSFQSRFYDHHKMDCAKKNGANVICLMQVATEQIRDSTEKDLLAAYATKCNEVLNPITPK